MSIGGPSAARVAAFFGVAFLITWGLQVPAALAKMGVLEGPAEKYMGLLGLGLFGPLLGAVIMSRAESGGIRGLFAQLGNWRVHPLWYVLALVTPGALMTAGMAGYRVATGDDPGPWTYIPHDPPRIMALFLIPFTEEIGWRGYALPRLQALTGRVWAAVILGSLWALWHIPMFIVQDLQLSWMALYIVFFIGGSFSFNWLYNRARMSLPIAIAAHMGAHLDSSMASMPGNNVPFLSQFAGYVVLAIALLTLDRKAWRPGLD